jgi:hypothetical protein
MRQDPVLWAAVIANTFFWFLGAILLLNIVLYATDVLQVDEARSSYLLAALSLGIGAGSYIAGYASGRKIEMGMILPGLTGIVLATGALFGCDGAAVRAGNLRGIFCGASERVDTEPAEAGGEGAGDWGVEFSFVRRDCAAAGGAVCDAAAGTSRPGAFVSDRVAGVRGDGVCPGADAAGIVAVRAPLDAPAAKG